MSVSGRFAHPCAVRLLLAPLAGLLVLPVLPVGPADAAGQVRISAVVRDAAGHLSVRAGVAADLTQGRQLVERWRAEKGVLAAAIDHRIHVAGSPDPLADQQWGPSALRLPQVGTATGQLVAIVDTGVDAGHPDLAGVVLPGIDCQTGLPGGGCGGTGSSDPNGHGTHVAGIVAAVADNGIGGAGLAQGAQILPVRVMAADGSGWDSDAAQGVFWAVDHGATVINLSFGGPDHSTVMDSAVSYALGKGVSVVVAAGNEGETGNPVEWPAADPGVIAVGAVDDTGAHPAWSNTGSHLALVAPGVKILSTLSSRTPASSVDPADPAGYATWDGTSMAAPFVSAAAALLRHAQPTLNVAAVRQRLMDTADDLGPPGFDPVYGAGFVDVVAAEAATTPIDLAAPAPYALSARISSNRSTSPYLRPITVSTRVLANGIGADDLPVMLQRQVDGVWYGLRLGLSNPDGLVSWVLNPDETMTFRVVGVGFVSPAVRVVVTPVIAMQVSTTGVSGRVAPIGFSGVRIDQRRGTAWVPVASMRTALDGTFRLYRHFARGTVLRAVTSSIATPATAVR
ncbi:MAG: hypothetical protein JWP11_566 [Frankiales bacterium]|nr:hypothetical protein [Frankiales bacterium]